MSTTTEHSTAAAIKAFAKKFITRVRDGTLYEEPTMGRDLEGLIIQKNKEADDASKAWKALGKTELYASQDFLDAIKVAKADNIEGLGHPGCGAVYVAVEKVLRDRFKGKLVLDKRGMSNPLKTQAKADVIDQVNAFWSGASSPEASGSAAAAKPVESSGDETTQSASFLSDFEYGLDDDVDIVFPPGEDEVVKPEPPVPVSASKKRAMPPTALPSLPPPTKKPRLTVEEKLKSALSGFMLEMAKDTVQEMVEAKIQDSTRKFVESEQTQKFITEALEKSVKRAFDSSQIQDSISGVVKRAATEIVRSEPTREIMTKEITTLIEKSASTITPFRKSVEDIVISSIAERFSK